MDSAIRKKDPAFFSNQIRGLYWISDTLTINKGVIKFRYNNDWTFNFGLHKDSMQLVHSGADIPVKAGTYLIQLNLTDPANPRFQMKPIVIK